MLYSYKNNAVSILRLILHYWYKLSAGFDTGFSNQSESKFCLKINDTQSKFDIVDTISEEGKEEKH